MKSHTEYVTFNTNKQREYTNITDRVAEALGKSGVREGLALVAAMHITAGVWINDAEPGIIADIDEMLEGLSPQEHDYRHHRTGEDNGHAHLKNIVVGNQVIIPVTDGRLDFGPWQQVYYCEWDGQRPKRMIIKIIGE
jgi:secondary thiamine-phosphate synthase enzyme